MKLKFLICTLLCVIIMGTTVFAAPSAEETLADNTTQQTETIIPGEQQMPQQGQIPPRGQMPEGGAMPQGGFVGRGGQGAEGMPQGNFGDFGGNMPMPGWQQQGNDFSGTETTVEVDYSSVISSAIILVLGFFFVIFYKRRTF